jgi:hypothetical protein
MPNLYPISNLPYQYIRAIQAVWASNTTLTMFPGICRDSTNIVDINVGNFNGVNPNIPANTTTNINLATQGVNGLDTHFGIAANTWYYVFVIADQSGYKSPGFIFSLNVSQPLLPQGYNVVRRVASIKTDGSGNILVFFQAGIDTLRRYQWQAAINVLTMGGATSYTGIDLSAGVPPGKIELVSLNARYVPEGDGNQFRLIPFGTAQLTTPPYIASGTAGGTEQDYLPFTMFPGLNNINNPAIQYLTDQSGDQLTLNVCGFDETI